MYSNENRKQGDLMKAGRVPQLRPREQGTKIQSITTKDNSCSLENIRNCINSHMSILYINV